MTESNVAVSPLQPRLVFRVGVVGHRWNKLGGEGEWRTGPGGLARTKALEAWYLTQVASVLRTIRESATGIGGAPNSGYRSASPQGPFEAEFVVVSAVAEGADRIVAHAGLAEGYRLDLVLPFAAADYRKDFDEEWEPKNWSRPGSAGEFDELLRQARTVVVTDGIVGRDDRYAPLSRAVIEHSDLIIAFWNRGLADGVGGTEEVLHSARRSEVPIVRVESEGPGPDPKRPGVWLENLARSDEGQAEGLSQLPEVLQRLVARPRASSGEEHGAVDLLDRFFGERIPSGRIGKAYGAMARWVARPMADWLPTFLIWPGVVAELRHASFDPDIEGSVRKEWTEEWTKDPAVPEPMRNRLSERLALWYGWADRFASYYANRYRSAYTLIFSLAWVAVVVAVAGLGAEVTHQEWLVGVTTAVEMVAVLVASGLVWLGNHNHFQEKWIDYRSLAERLRHLTFLWPVGRNSTYARAPQAEDPGDLRLSWFAWLFRAYVRELGLYAYARNDRHEAEWTHDHLDACRRLLLDHELASQQKYHQSNAAKMSRLHHFAHRRTSWLFYAALAVGLVHAGSWVIARYFGAESAEPAGPPNLVPAILLAVLSVFLPSRAAALHGWVGQGDFLGSAFRSAQLKHRLAEVERVGRSLAVVNSRTLGDLSAAASRVMESDLAAWDAVARARPLVNA